MITFRTETEGFETYRVCEIEENEALDTVGIGMLRNNHIKGIASLSYSRLNDKRALRYNVSSKISLQQFFMGRVDKKRFLTVVKNIVGAVDILTDYMMDKDQLITDKSEIYVNVGTLDVEMLYCPLIKEKKELNLTTLIKSLITETEFDQSEGEYVARLINFLNKPGGFAPAELREFIDELLGKQDVNRQTVQNTNVASTNYMDSNVVNSNYSSVNSAPNVANTYNNSVLQASPLIQPAPMMQMQPAPMSQTFAVPGVPEGVQVISTSEEPEKKKKFSLFGSKKKKNDKEAEQFAKLEKKAAEVKKKEKKAAKATNKKAKDVVTPEGIIIPGVQERGGSLPTPPKPAGAQIKQDPAAYAAMYSAQMNEQQSVPVMQNSQPMMNQMQQPVIQQPIMQQPVMQQPMMQMQPEYNKGVTYTTNSAHVNTGNTPVMNTVVSNVSETTVLGGQGFSGETTVLSDGYNTVEKMRRPYLIRKRTNQKIDISKDIFRIGKEQSYVDFFVNDNTAISRSHADIVKRGDEYFIIDNNSLNHTYVNGEQIQSQVPTLLKDFDTVTLADEFFEYRL